MSNLHPIFADIVSTFAPPPKQPMSPNYRKRIEYVKATQLTQELIEAAVFDSAPLPVGVELVGSYSHPGNRVLYRADLRVGKESADIGDWVTTDAEGYTTHWASDIFERVFEPLAEEA